MTPSLPLTMQSFFVGVIATALLDLWAITLKRTFRVPTTNWGLVGRWIVGVPSGAIRRPTIASEPAFAHERLAGWLTHYVVGFIYAALYLLLLTAAGESPSLYSAVLFGLVTVLAPWLILQPGLGIGYFASRAPRPNLTRALNVLSHTVFGAGLYVGSVIWSLVG